MRMVHGALAASLALLLGVAGSAATLSHGAEAPQAPVEKQRRAAASAPLYPLSERDLTSTRQMGCTCTFDSRNRTLVQAIGNELMVRTAAGRQVCRISDAQFGTLSGGDSGAACGGVRMSFRQIGRRTSSPETDSSSAPTAMTLRQGRARRVVNGVWGCAC